MMFDQQEQAEIELRSFDASVRTNMWFGTGNLTRSGITLNQFWFFAAVAKHLNITKASEELRVSQPSISQQLRQLEDHYGSKLYRRLSKGVEITEAGRQFLRNITPILEQVTKLETGFRSTMTKVEREVLKVGGTFSASAELLPACLARLQQRHPKADLEFRTGRSEHLERLVLGSAMDLAVIAQRAYSEELISEPLRRESVILFVPAKHRLAKMPRLKLSDVVTEPFIIRGGKGISGVTEKAVKQLRDQGFEVKVGLRCEDPTAVKAAVRQRMGVGVAFEDTVKAEIKTGEFEILKVPGLELSGESFVIYLKTKSLSPLAQEFRELLRCSRSTKGFLDARSKSSNRSIAPLRSRRPENSRQFEMSDDNGHP
jgi:DNA-binding transcriptional LysR family regulator